MVASIRSRQPDRVRRLLVTQILATEVTSIIFVDQFEITNDKKEKLEIVRPVYQ